MLKSQQGTLTTAEVILLQKLDLAELHQFELARELSISLLKEWLTKYKFKDWNETQTQKLAVTREMKEERAEFIARELSKHDRWQTHGRGIGMETLRNDLKLRIDDFGADSKLHAFVWNYFWCMRDHMNRHGVISYVHSLSFF